MGVSGIFVTSDISVYTEITVDIRIRQEVKRLPERTELTRLSVQPVLDVTLKAMGTDYLQLLDRRPAEIIMGANESDLAAVVDLRTTVYRPSVWKHYWDESKQALVEFNFTTTAVERLKILIDTGSTLEEIKEKLLRELCVSYWQHVDYWGCSSEVFRGDPPGAITWEEFTAPVYTAGRSKQEPIGSSGCYLLTRDNVDSILQSLDLHRHELQIMGDTQIERLRCWQAFCRKNAEFCILYQIDF